MVAIANNPRGGIRKDFEPSKTVDSEPPKLLLVPLHRCFLAVVLSLLIPMVIIAEGRPNIVFVLVDDLGWMDLGCYGHGWHDTPNIDRLAEHGVRFTDAYAPAPICTASRASILTGNTVARVGLEFVVKNEPGSQVIDPPQELKAPPITAGLELDEVTIAEHLQTAGYATAYFGKWHLNSHHKRYLGWSPSHGPDKQGFETAFEDFGSHPYSKKKLKSVSAAGRYHPDGITERAVSYLKQNRERPFFLMVSHFYVHTPIRSPYDWLKKKYVQLVPENSVRRRERVEYAAFVETLDHHIGELLAAIDDAELRQNTLVVFMSDNGGHPEYTSNQPLRGSKWNLYEGGIRVPLIARWPSRIQSGIKSTAPVIGYDLFATFAAAAGQPAANSDGVDILALLENSVAPVARPLFWHFPYYHPEGSKFGRAKPDIGVDDFVTSQTRPHSAIRHGDHKLIYFEEDGRTELYDLRRDLSEQKNIQGSQAGMAANLKLELLRHLNRVEARRAK